MLDDYAHWQEIDSCLFLSSEARQLLTLKSCRGKINGPSRGGMVPAYCEEYWYCHSYGGVAWCGVVSSLGVGQGLNQGRSSRLGT